MTWNLTRHVLPPEGKYVLVHLVKDNWIDSDDIYGVYYKVAKLIKGISMPQRQLMKAGTLEDYLVTSYTLPDNMYTEHTYPRSRSYQFGDEYGNNLVPYAWSAFGPDSYFGQEVDKWMFIPQ